MHVGFCNEMHEQATLLQVPLQSPDSFGVTSATERIQETSSYEAKRAGQPLRWVDSDALQTKKQN